MKEENESSDVELLQSMMAGDEEALAVLYRRRKLEVYRFAYQMCGSKTVAEDIAQDVFLAFIRDARNFDATRGTLKAFLLGVARNHVLRRLRRERFYVTSEAPSETHVNETRSSASGTGPLEDLTRTERIESLRKAILTLPEKYREVIVLCELEEMSYAEAAQILECAVGTIRSRLHRGRALLTEKLRPIEKDETALALAKPARCFA